MRCGWCAASKDRPSPEWLQKRLTSIGLRPINALVDITNFMTYDRARPLHVFDARKVTGNLTVRRARDGETLLALDGRIYALDDSICVIADDDGAQVAGRRAMGGEASGCDENTTDVLIESALWNEINITQSITFTPDSRTVYVSTCGTKSITAIDVETMKEVTRIPVGEMPDRISTLVLK